MKNNVFFLLALFSLLIIILGILFYQYQARQLSLQLYQSPSEDLLIETADDNSDSIIPASTENPFIEQAPLSDQTDLETIQQELHETIILEEEFSDL